jgi:hypothetical protein
MHTYLQHVGFIREDAIAHQLWNSRLSKAMRFPLETTEIVVRNRVHSAFTDRWGANWYRKAGFLSHAADKTKQKIDAADTKTMPNNTPDRVVAALSFGFWPAMFNDGYVTDVWQTRLDHTFPNLPAGLGFDDKIALIRTLLKNAQFLRNRVSHLEPIFYRDLSRDHSDLTKLVTFACKDTARWMKHHSTLTSVMRDGPSAVVRETIPFRTATKNFIECPSDCKLDKAFELLTSTGADYLAVDIDGAVRVLSGTEIGRWLVTKAADGIVDLTENTVEAVLAVSEIPPLLSRKESISVYLSEISKRKSRYVVINEEGKAGQKALAILDSLALLAR